ncbi:ABC transporter substrate-binding protein/permease [Carnobacterium gallinarum]
MVKKSNFKKIASLIGVFVIIFSFVFPAMIVSAEGEITDTKLKAVQEKGFLVVGLSADYPPYEFHQTIDGEDKIVGFDIDIANKVADDMGVKLVITEMNFDSLLGALQTGKLDMIISGIAPTPERLKQVAFSEPYMEVTQKVIVRKGDGKKYTKVTDFDGVKVGVQKQTTQEALAKNELYGSKPVSLQKVPDLILNLQEKKVDALVLEGPVADAYLSQNDDMEYADVKFTDGDKQTAVAIEKDNPAFKAQIDKSIKEIKDKDLLKGYQEKARELMFQKSSFIQQYGSYFVKGTMYTILLAIIGVIFGAILGSVLALMKLSKTKLLRWPAAIYVEYVRGTPLLVQTFIVFFGGTALFGLDLSAFTSSCIALSLNSAAYVAEIIRAGIKAVNKGQTESARSLGMSQGQSMRYIILPQAVKNILPALGNEFVTVIKESSVVSVIGVTELMFQTGVVQGASFKPFLPLVITSLIYFVLTFTLSRLLGVAERRMQASD